MGDQIDLSDLVASSDVSIKPSEHSDERDVRLEAERRRHRIEAYEGVLIFAIFAVAVTAVCLLCIYRIFLDPLASEDAKRGAQSLLIPVLTGVVSFLAGRKIGSK